MKKTSDIPNFPSYLASEPYVQHLLSLVHSLSERLEVQDKKIGSLTIFAKSHFISENSKFEIFKIRHSKSESFDRSK